MRRYTNPTVLTLLGLGLFGCIDSSTGDKGEMDITGELGSGKADAGKKAKIIDDVGPESHVVAKFNPRTRVYGYVIQARAGAKLNMAVTAKAGADSEDLDEGEDLDSLLQLYGPYKGPGNPGAQIAYHDDTNDSLVAPPIDFAVPDDGHYLLALSSWDDTGTGDYEIKIKCQGTDFQCRRPDFANPCKPGQLFIQGANIDEDQTWDRCEVVLLEPTTVGTDAILTIRPGVTVKGNYLGTGNWGNVSLTVDGTVQAGGTEKDPIRFTSLVADRGWAGIVLNGQASAIENAFIERASTGITVGRSASANVSNVVVEGMRNANGATLGGTGILVQDDGKLEVAAALIKHFSTGVRVTRSDDVGIVDSVVRDNTNGIIVDGDGTNSTSCGQSSSPPVRWRDPRVSFTDIVHNSSRGIQVNGMALVQVDHTNLVRNGSFALEVRSNRLHEDSFIHESNIDGNGNVDIFTSHRPGRGTLDITGNYWVDISDPQLSSNWSRTCSGPIRFDGFSPTEIVSAGPRFEGLFGPVCDATHRPCESGGEQPEEWEGLDVSGTIRSDEEERWSTPELVEGNYVFNMTGTRDADLYVRVGEAPTINSFDCRPFQSSSDESCRITVNQPAPIHVMVRGWASESEFHIVGERE